MLLVGAGVKPGLHHAVPALDRLERGDVPFSVDFRRIYQSLLGGWLGVDAARVLSKRLAPLPVLRG